MRQSSRMRPMPFVSGTAMTSSMSGLVATTGAAACSTRYVRRASGKRRRSARMAGVVKTTSPIIRSRMSRMFIAPELRLDGRLVQQHHGDVVLDGVDALAALTLEGGSILHGRHRCLALRTRQDGQQLRVDGHGTSSARHYSAALLTPPCTAAARAPQADTPAGLVKQSILKCLHSIFSVVTPSSFFRLPPRRR